MTSPMPGLREGMPVTVLLGEGQPAIVTGFNDDGTVQVAFLDGSSNYFDPEWLKPYEVFFVELCSTVTSHAHVLAPSIGEAAGVLRQAIDLGGQTDRITTASVVNETSVRRTVPGSVAPDSVVS